MKNQIKRLTFVLLLPVLAPLFQTSVHAVASDSKLLQSLVLVQVTPLEEDVTRPWINEQGKMQIKVGLVISGNRILVPDVRNAALIQVKKSTSNYLFTAKLIRTDESINCSVLESTPEFFSDLKPATFGSEPTLGSNLTAIHLDTLFRIQRSNAVVSEFDSESRGIFVSVPVGIFVSVENFPRGGVLVSGDEIAGYIHDTGANRKTSFFMPSLLTDFATRSADKNFSGYGSIGFDYEAVLDPVLKKHFKVPAGKSGPIVTTVYPGTSTGGALKSNDIILEIDGSPLDERGFFVDKDRGKQDLDLLFFMTPGRKVRQPGSSIRLNVLRDGKPLSLNVTLRPYTGGADRISSVRRKPSPYRVESGLVFIELSLSYLLGAFGTSYSSVAPELAYLSLTRMFREKEGDDRIVILTRSLPDDTNLTYETFSGSPLVKAGGQPVRNLKHFGEIITTTAKSGQKFLKLEFSSGRILFLDMANRNAINDRVRKKYGVPADFRD